MAIPTARTRLPAVPEVPPGTDPRVAQVLLALKEIAEVGAGVRGDPADRAVTFRDLAALGLIPADASR